MAGLNEIIYTYCKSRVLTCSGFEWIYKLNWTEPVIHQKSFRCYRKLSGLIGQARLHDIQILKILLYEYVNWYAKY